ncbi:MAG: DUF2332 domain-containing protein [Gammaproteobacteria bacterium]|nr:DUF2332 domain-containing protein [Gammaproteobacteria bacterium]
MTETTIPAALRLQAKWCQDLGSPLTAALLAAAAADFDHAGITRDLLADFPHEPVAAALALRLAGALHHAVLAGRDNELAKFYPSAGGRFDPEVDGPALWAAARASLEADSQTIRSILEHPPQTNEVTRSGVLLGGFLIIAQRSGLPLALREVGASAGLNLLFDHYYYDLGSDAGSRTWGDAASPVRIRSLWRGQPPDLSVGAPVASRAACDRHPLPIATAAQRHGLEAYVWPDQLDRLQRLRSAMELAHRVGVTVEAVSADEWISRELAQLPAGQVTVVYHSIVRQYLPDAVRTSLHETIAAAGERASRAAPLAHLTMEPRQQGGTTQHRLELTLWPGGRREPLAEVHPHGNEALWLET